MSRYFFNVICGEHVYRDRVGQEFSNREAARNEARMVAAELVRDAALTDRTLDHLLEVTDANGGVIIMFRCSDPEIVQARSRSDIRAGG